MRRSVFRFELPRATPRCPRRFLVPVRPTCRRESSSALRPAPAKQSAQKTDPKCATPAVPFRFETGIALFAKRTPRPFPPPFLSPPSGSFSDPLSTHHRSRDRRMYVEGEMIRGFTNGDDAVYASEHFIGANDGVGAWSTREGGHAGLWSRLILHFWALESEKDARKPRGEDEMCKWKPRPVEYLQAAYEHTIKATSEPNKWQGTTTATGAQLHYQCQGQESAQPVLYVTNIGDSQVMVIRPRHQEAIYRSTTQWHWFDCPRQLGTNSPDTPTDNAVIDVVEIEENDVVLAMSDGVIDNLWEHEIVENVVDSLRAWEAGQGGEDMPAEEEARKHGQGGGMNFVADRLMHAARVIAQDPFAESPFMEHAVEEGLAMEGGKMDDISVVAALCRRSNG